MPHNTNRALLFACLGCFAFAACSREAPDDPLARRHESVGYINGTAKVLSLDQAMGHAVLQIDGRQVQAYWLIQADLPQGGTVTPEGPIQTGVGQYVPPVVHPQNFNAVPGDTIAFVGLKTGDDILLRGIKVIAHAR